MGLSTFFVSGTCKSMRNFFLIFLLLSSLLLTAGIFATGQVRGQNQNIDELDMEDLAWSRSTIDILLVTPNNQSWWNPIYINSVLRAVGQWNEAIQYYSANNTQYAYLAALKLVPTVSNESLPGFNIYLNWTQSTIAGSSDDIGLTTLSDEANVITHCNINLATHTSHGDALADGDEQNIALHELGHSLGLGHSNYTGDVMYPALTLLGSAKLLSTLDLYGVATSFAWMSSQFKFYPVMDWLSGDPLLLPQSQYQALPVSSQYARPQTLQNNFIIQNIVLVGEILTHPDVIVWVIFFAAIYIVIYVVHPKKDKQETKGPT